MNRMDPEKLNLKSAFAKMPALIKGYLRLGAIIGPQAVIDHQFGTIDVMIILPVKNLNPRYVKYYGVNAERYMPTK
jgi:putative hemolysin